MANSLPEPMLLVSASGAIEAANAAFMSAFGYRRDELAGRELAEILQVGNGDLPAYLRRCAGTRQLIFAASTLRTPRGAVVACRCEGALHTPRDGDSPARLLLRFIRKEQSSARFVALTQQLAALSAEIAKRQLAERELEAQRDLLQVTLGSIGDAVITTDGLGHVTFMNAAAESLTGWQLADAAGRPVPDVFAIISERTRQPVENPVAKVLAEGRIVGLANHTLLITRDGVERPIDDSGAPIVGPSGRVHGVVLVFRDVSEVRTAEREQSAARRAAEAANQAKDRFLAMLSHELRTPLNAILGWTRILVREDLTAERRRHGLAVIERNAALQARLVEDLLDISRITEGKLQLREEAFDLPHVIHAAIEAVRPAAEKRQVLLSASVDATRALRGDPDRIQQAIWNLLSNAVKFTPPGGGVALSASQNPASVRIVVQDSGIGFSPAFKPFLFDPFSQEDSSFGRTHGGLGLGLAIARRLIEAHGGTVAGDSAGPGQGAVFTIELPVRRQRDERRDESQE